MAVNTRVVGMVLCGGLVVALSACKADDAAPAVAAPDHAQPVERSADADHVAAQPVDAMMMGPAESAGQAAPADAMEMKRSEDGSTLQIRKVDAATADDGGAAMPAKPAH